MIGAHRVGEDFGPPNLGNQITTSEHVIDTPSHIALARTAKGTPPGVMAIALREHAKSIDESLIYHIVDSLTLLFGETLLTIIRLRIGQVVWCMSHVEISAKNDRLFSFELLTVGEEGRVPVFVAELEAAQIVFCIRGIDGNNVEIGVFCCNDAPLAIRVAVPVIFDAKICHDLFRQPQNDAEGLFLGKNRRATITLLLRRVPILFILGQIYLRLMLVRLGLLETKHIRLYLFDKGSEHSLLMERAYTIDVPRNDTHAARIARQFTTRSS